MGAATAPFAGGHCVHGTAIGTPGGADLMCGACEDERTNLVDCESGNMAYRLMMATFPVFVFRRGAMGKGYLFSFRFRERHTIHNLWVRPFHYVAYK
jgi:hypothetical protein